MPSWLREILKESFTATELAPSPIFKQFARHRIEIVDGNLLDDGVIDLTLRDFNEGRSVLVAANAVRVAQQSTQVIEVSLNLDFDTIVTEPAPLEAAQLLIPMSWDNVKWRLDRFPWDEQLRVRTAQYSYDSEYGLRLDS